jgi:hypothetical protein
MGTYEVLTATNPAGPWHSETSGTVPGCQALQSGFCYALVGHPELSTSSQLVITYYDPGSGPMGTSGPVGHLVAAGTSYVAPPPGDRLATLPQFGAPNTRPDQPPRSINDQHSAGQTVSSGGCCVAGYRAAIDSEPEGRIQGGSPVGPLVQDLNYSYSSGPPNLGSPVRLDREKSDSQDRVLKFLIEGLSACLIVESLRRRIAVIAGKRMDENRP